MTVEEWLAACDLLIEAGKVSSPVRNEMVRLPRRSSLVSFSFSLTLFSLTRQILVTDVLGVESLVDMMEHARSASADATESCILGPFSKAGVSVQANATSIIRQPEPGAPFVHLHGRVFGAEGEPLKGALVDVWHDVRFLFSSSLSLSEEQTNPARSYLSPSEGSGRSLRRSVA